MKRLIPALLAATFSLGMLAVPAKPGPLKHVQPDGTVIFIRLAGDEHGHSIFSSEGYLLLDDDGCMEYARFGSDGIPKPSGIAVSSVSIDASVAARLQPKELLEEWKAQTARGWKAEAKANSLRSLAPAADSDSEEGEDAEEEKRLVPMNFGRCASTFPALGHQKGLVVLVEYQDVAFTYGDSVYFHRMLNEEGFSDNGSLSSARDWFISNSGGRFIPDFDVYGPVLLPEKRSFYGANDVYGNDKHAELMAVHALEILDESVDFSQYDRDGDGEIDNVFIFYAGKGEHDTGIANTVWPHSWELSQTSYDPFIFDEVQLNHYACSCEYPSGYTRPDGIGTFVHEFSHVMGLPDLYVTTYSSGFTPGSWNVLDTGPYNNEGLTPPNYSSFERCALGWMDLIPVEAGKVEIPNLADSNTAYVMPTERPQEFYFFENRQQSGNDRFVPGHGMLVWHIDYNEQAWDYNTVNNISSHQYVDLVEADNKKSEHSRSADSFPGTAGVTEFRCDVVPKFLSWKKVPLEFDIVDIAEAEEDGMISFTAVTHDDLHGDDNAVDSVVSDIDEGEWHDLMGRKVRNPSKGIYIKDGKKIALK